MAKSPRGRLLPVIVENENHSRDAQLVDGRSCVAANPPMAQHGVDQFTLMPSQHSASLQACRVVPRCVVRPSPHQALPATQTFRTAPGQPFTFPSMANVLAPLSFP